MQMHWCVCKVNLSGQGFTIHEFNSFEPVSWPEVQVISALHGDDNVFEIKPVRVGESSLRMEKERLMAKYGYVIVEKVFPGRSFHMEMLMPGEETNQPEADNEGVEVASEDGTELPIDPALTAPVFKPGKQRPASA